MKDKSGYNTGYHPLSDEDRKALYAGEVELVMSPPVDLKLAAQLFNALQTINEAKIVRTRGTFNRGASITVALDKPLPLIETLASKLPDIYIHPDTSRRNGTDLNDLDPSSIARREAIKRILLVPKESKLTTTNY